MNASLAQQLCRQHIIAGQHILEDTRTQQTRRWWTLAGQEITVTFNQFTKYSYKYKDQPQQTFNIYKANNIAANGVFHVVTGLRWQAPSGTPGDPKRTIGQILASTEAFSRFETILENCGLPSILDGPGPFTVFAPSNEAVDSLRDGRLIYLFTALTVEKLISKGRILTMANQVLAVNISEEGRILLGPEGVPLQRVDVMAANGVIHMLDGILLPPTILPILPKHCSEEQHKIVAGSCVDCQALNTSTCPPNSVKLDIFPKECVYIHDPTGLNVLKKGCASYCNQTIMEQGCCKGFFGPDCTQCPGGFSNPCYGKGNSRCTCKLGFAGDGYQCSPIDPCRAGNGGCHGLATCRAVGGGQRVCTCPPGFGGDGFSCYGDIFRELEANAHFSIFYQWLKSAGITLPADRRVTALVPSEAAVRQLSPEDRAFWLQPRMLPNLVRAHFLQGALFEEELARLGGQEVATLNPTTRWEIRNISGRVWVQNASVDVADLLATNGVLHILSQVLLPPRGDVPGGQGLLQQLDLVPAFSLFRELLQHHRLVPQIEAATAYTIFVPTNRSLEAQGNSSHLDADTVRHHVVLGEALSMETLRKGGHRNSLLGPAHWIVFYNHSGQEKCVNCTRRFRCTQGFQLQDTPRKSCVYRSGFSFSRGCSYTCAKKIQNNGGCSPYATCKSTGDGQRTCTCDTAHTVGDGLTCRARVGLEYKELKGDGPFTIFVPHADLMSNLSQDELARIRAHRQLVFRYHVVGCRRLRSEDLLEQGYATALSGHPLRFSEREGSIYLNDFARVVSSDHEAVNGILHFIDRVLLPPEALHWEPDDAPIPRVASLLPLLREASHRPFTMLWPTDATFRALPPDRQAWLYHEDHRDKLAAILRGHMIRNVEGELMVGEDDARIVQRHLPFEGGLAYGIDQLLEPPGLGARCDRFETRPLRLNTCSICGLEPPCPEGSQEQGSPEACWRFYPKFWTSPPLHSLGLRSVWVHPSLWGRPQGLGRGCHRNCVTTTWKPSCCPGHYGSECQACPGGPSSPCSDRGVCMDGMSGSGQCLCRSGFAGTACELCAPGAFGPHCQACRCTVHGRCDEGLGGSGSCFCDEGWTGPRCEVQLGNSCECSLGYEGDGRVCTVADLCQDGHGGCSEHANCSQVGTVVTCTCLPDYEGDGWSCRARNPCTDGHRGGCSEHANCLSTGLLGFHLCLMGWLANGSTAHPVVFPVADCGNGRVGIVSLGARKNLSERWDAYCFRVQDVACRCRDGFVGDGISTCNGKLLDVLAATANFSTFYGMLLGYANATQRGLDFLDFLDDELTYKTLFVPVNEGFVDNMTLSGPDLELHASNATLLSANASQGKLLPAHSGLSLIISDAGPDNSSWAPVAPGTVVVSHIIVWDIMAFNGIIHALASPLLAPPQPQAVLAPEAPPVAAGVGAVLAAGALLGLVAGALYLRARGKPTGFGFSAFQRHLL
ncbi:STAB1 isoform 4 [Pan troglodytes]|uniref:STAB1 isoform 4 n=1 Tax=Pan troglodytes TaxID=9598 RepID=A0A2J8P8D0_PANTR|nr:STAB1 isoform 4 [Pan troglodytes]